MPSLTPLWQWSFNLGLHVEVFFSTAATEQVVWITAPTLSTKPTVHIRAVAAIALAVGAAATARMTLLHVLVKAGHARPAELANHHLITVFRFAHVLTQENKTKGTTNVRLDGKFRFGSKYFGYFVRFN